MATRETSTGCGALFFGAAVSTGVALLRFGFGKTRGLDSALVRIIIMMGFILWGVAYALLKEVRWFKVSFGLAQIIGALWADWYQLAATGNQPVTGDRWVFLGAALAVLSKGMKDVYEGVGNKDSNKSA
jgi:hypothetical protein